MGPLLAGDFMRKPWVKARPQPAVWRVMAITQLQIPLYEQGVPCRQCDFLSKQGVWLIGAGLSFP